MTETFYATQQVRVLTGQGWPPAGIECCVVRGQPRLRSVHRERAGRVMEPRKRRCGVDVVNPAEDHIAGPEVAWGRGSAGVEERGMYARVVQEPGRSRLLHRDEAARAPR